MTAPGANVRSGYWTKPKSRWLARGCVLAAGSLLLLAGACRVVDQRAAEANRFDVLIRGGKIVDGTGNPWYYGDLAIRADRIVRIAAPGVLTEAIALDTIDATGMVVAPGFIDIQGHSRKAFLRGDGRVVSKVTQGITTEIMGEGDSNAPANSLTLAADSLADTALAETNTSFTGQHAFAKWLNAMEAHGVSVNVGSFVGAATVRIYAKGMAPGPATPAELDTMRAVVARAMQDGAFGIASALIYPPGSYASTDELVEMSKAMRPYGGLYITHLRSEADRYLEALDEAITIGQQAGVPVEIYHLKAAGVRNWPKAALAIARIDSARAAGLDVQADMYPYLAGSTGLASCLPPWASENGQLFENLADSSARARMHDEMLADTSAWEDLCALATPSGVMIVGFEKEANKPLEGARLDSIARLRGGDWAETVMDLTLDERAHLGGLFFLASEENVELQLRQPWIKFGTDATGYDPDSATEMVHPRSYGTYPRILGEYVRERKVLTLEDAVRKMTSAVATRLGIRDRGMLREGMFADVVIFDPATVGDRATYAVPHQLSTGIREVFVNGIRVVRNGVHTGAKPGRVVRRGG
jgi:dihydroorotase/N-acyl-D-amino-acid deacylase